MAYRAMPHCYTRYSACCLVFGREMRLPIEEDWAPHLKDKKLEGDEYEQHVRLLAERLREANKAAGQQSRMSHKTAKRYYDRQTKLEQYQKGTWFMYMTLRISGVKLGNFYISTRDLLKWSKGYPPDIQDTNE